MSAPDNPGDPPELPPHAGLRLTAAALAAVAGIVALVIAILLVRGVL